MKNAAQRLLLHPARSHQEIMSTRSASVGNVNFVVFWFKLGQYAVLLRCINEISYVYTLILVFLAKMFDSALSEMMLQRRILKMLESYRYL